MSTFSNYEDKISLLNQCIKTLQIIPSKRTPNDLALLLKLAEEITFFKNLQQQNSEIVQKCMQVLSQRTIKKDETLFSVGDYGSLFYIILKGSVSICIKLPSAEDPKIFELKEVNILLAGNSFGELALLNDTAKRTATIISKEDCVFAVMEKHHYKNILGAQEQQKIQDKIGFLCSFPFLQTWSFREIKTISYHFEPMPVTLNQVVIKQNDYCSNFYVVKEGNFEVQYLIHDPLRFKGVPSTHSICVLGPGEFFGEEAFLLEDGETFQLKLYNIFTVKWAKLKCNVVCRSQFGSVLRITREDIIRRFWDEKTSGVFLSLLQSIHKFRLHQMEIYERQTETLISQIKGEEGIHQFVQPLLKPSVKKYNTLKKHSLMENSDKEFIFYKKQEQKAFEQFKQLFKDRNCSYAQVRTFFDKRTITSQNYIDRDSYFKLFFRFPSRQNKKSFMISSLSQHCTTSSRISNKLTTQPRDQLQETPKSLSYSRRTKFFLQQHRLDEMITDKRASTQSNFRSKSPVTTHKKIELRKFGSQSYFQFR